MSSATTTTYDPVLKYLYPQERVENLVYDGAPLLAMLPKANDFYGKALVLALQYGNPQGTTATFAKAQSNALPSSMEDFILTRKRHYSVATLETELIEASKNDKGALVDALKNEMDGAFAQLGRRWHSGLYGNGGGAIGRVTTGGTGTSFTLTSIEDVANFEIGQEIVFSTADGTSGSLKAGSVTVNGVNRDTGVVTVDAMSAIASGSGTANNDYVFIDGDFGAMFTGLAGWIPTSAPSSTAFFGVDRSVDTVRLGGCRYDGSGDADKQAALINGLTKLARQGAKARPDAVFMNVVDFGDLIVELDAKVQYEQTRVNGGKATIGFDSVELHSPAGTVKVIADFQCPKGRAYALKLSTWKWHGLGDGIGIIKTDGLSMIRQASADGVEFRLAVRGQLGCTAPGWNCVITLP